MRKFLFSPNTYLNLLLWLVAVAIQILGWVNHLVAYILLGVAFLWSIVTIIYWFKWRERESSIEKVPTPVPLPLDRSVKEKLPDGRILTTYPPRVIVSSPRSEDKIQKVMFKTEAGGEVHIPTSGSPKALRFLRPHEVIIREDELPKEVPTGDGRLVVKKFTPTGFIVEEISTYNVQVEAEVYLKRE